MVRRLEINADWALRERRCPLPAEALLASPFAALPDIIRAHAAERPDLLALVEGGEALTYGGLAALMDRIAFALQRDGVRSRRHGRDLRPDLDQYGAAFCGVLAAGAAVAPLAPSSTPASLMMMLKDSGARFFLLDRETAEAFTRDRPSKRPSGALRSTTARRASRSRDWLGPEGAKPA